MTTENKHRHELCAQCRHDVAVAKIMSTEVARLQRNMAAEAHDHLDAGRVDEAKQTLRLLFGGNQISKARHNLQESEDVDS